MRAARGIGSAPSSRLADGYLHTCAVEEQGAATGGVGGQMYGAKITLGRCSAFTLAATKRFQSF